MQISLMAKVSVVVLFFISTLWLVVGQPVVFNSPDENANYFFALSFAQTGQMSVVETDNLSLGGRLHPRSTIVIGEKILPKSFLGFTALAGSAALIFGKFAPLLLTPILAVLAVLAWRAIVNQLFDNHRLADWSAFLLMIHPAFWYYSARTMMHNVAFLALLVISFWLLICQPVQKLCSRYQSNFFDKLRNLDWAIGGMMFTLAVAVRTSEVLWLSLLLLFLLWCARKIVSRSQIGLFILGGLIVALPFGYLNQVHYGHFWDFGYTVASTNPEINLAIEVPDEQIDQVVASENPGLTRYLLPFGFHEMNIWHNVWNYGLKLYPWMGILALVGFIFAFVNRDRRWRTLAFAAAGVAVWLGIVYGSWWFADNPDPNVISLGNSHVRYWLPVFCLLTPMLALVILSGLKQIRSVFMRNIISVIIAMVMTGLSLNLVFFGIDGLQSTRVSLAQFAQKRTEVIAATEPEAIVIVDHADKYLFPERRVVVPLRSQVTYGLLPALEQTAPLYYFGLTLPPEDLVFLNSGTLAELSLHIVPFLTSFDETLYIIETLENYD